MYSLRENPPEEVMKELDNFTPIVQRMLFTIGITKKDDADYFFEKNFDYGIVDPFVFKDMEKVVGRTIEAIEKKETIGIYSDYDCDGIPGAAILYNLLKLIGHKNVVHFTPERNLDGFGIHEKGIEELKGKGAKLIFTIDCGISDTKVIDKYESDLDIVILDHHIPGDSLPKSYGIINPLLEDEYPKPYPCGAGCAYKFIQALLKKGNFDLPVGYEKWFLDLAGIATLADMVPLLGENRLFLHYGLIVLRKGRRAGINALCRLLRIDQRNISEEDLSFMIIPHINAASRMGRADLSFELLTTDDEARGMQIAKELKALNDRRKREVTKMVKEANKRVMEKDKNLSVWVFGDTAWKVSLVGLVAQKLSEEFGKTIFVWGKTGSDKVKGSARSAQLDLYKLMDETKDSFEEFGGHRQAGGFTIKGNEVINLEDNLNLNSNSIKDEKKELVVDAEVSIREAKEIFNDLKGFMPFGNGNQKPMFALSSCEIRESQKFGRGHSKYVFRDNSGILSGVSFFNEPEEEGEVAAVCGFLEYDNYTRNIRLRVKKIFR